MPDIWGLASIAFKFFLYLGVFGSTGMVLFLLVFQRQIQPVIPKIKTHAIGFALLSLIAAAFSFSLRAAALTGDASGMIDPEMLGLLWQTSVGEVLVSRMAGMTLILVGFFLPRIGLWVSAIGGVIALWSFSQIGHIPDTEIHWLRLLLLLHLLCIAFWIGALSPLIWLCNAPELQTTAAIIGHRFGGIATIVVPVLLLAGVVMAWVLLGEIWNIVSTRYGLFLLVKILLVGILLGFATLNKLRFIPALQRGDSTAAYHLGVAIRFEWWIIIAVLATTAIFTSALSLPH